jgi:hypothetical protein
MNAFALKAARQASAPDLRFASGSPAPRVDSTKKGVIGSSQLTFILTRLPRVFMRAPEHASVA